MSRTVMVLNQPTLKVASTEAGLVAGQSVECQVTSAVVNGSPNYSTIPSTGCAGATQSPGRTSFALELAWLQDWTTPDPGGLSYFAWNNDGKAVWIELTPDVDDVAQKLTGQVFCAAGSYGGVFGDGSSAVSTATWPFVDKPVIPVPAVGGTRDAEAAPADADAATVLEPA